VPLVEIVLDPGLHQLDRIERYLQHLIKQGVAMNATLDQVLEDQQKEAQDLGNLATAIAGFKTSFAQLQQQLADALANQTISDEVQAKIDQAFANAESNLAGVDGALTALLPQAVPDSSAQPAAT
jgi:uncharacterized protein YoxC